ncbi:unnamed protein product [Aureobasidium pullulans]|nr:unnamed protein product [Aureobasidium pullulans]
MIENIWGYVPIVPLAVAAAAVFGLGAAIHLIQAIYYRTRFFVAFINIFILLPPSLYAATLYMTYSRLVVLVDEPQASILRPQMVTNFFVCIDIKTVTEAATKKHGRYSWKTLHSLLMAAAVLIIIRATYRIIEFSETEVFVGTLMRREGYAYVLDAVPMFVLQTMFSVVHAGQVLPRKGEGREKIEGYLGITADR